MQRCGLDGIVSWSYTDILFLIRSSIQACTPSWYQQKQIANQKLCYYDRLIVMVMLMHGPVLLLCCSISV
jgi:hypothetical protein